MVRNLETTLYLNWSTCLASLSMKILQIFDAMQKMTWDWRQDFQTLIFMHYSISTLLAKRVKQFR